MSRPEMPHLPSSNYSLMYGCEGEVATDFSQAEGLTYGTFLIMQFVLSTFGNLLVCMAIVRFPTLQTLSNTFIFSLAVTDLLTPLARVIFTAIAMFSKQWIFGCFWCQLSSVLGMFLCASSILHLCAISIERFVTIKWPLQYQNWITKPRVITVIANIWIASLLLSLFPYFGIARHTFNGEILDCEISWETNPKLAVLLTIFFFLLPFLIMILTYFYIFKEVYRQKRRISNIETQAEITRRKSLSTKVRIHRILKTELKAVRIIVVVIGFFFTFWSPWFVVTSYRAYRPDDVSGTAQRLVFAMAYTNASCNWIIYSVMNRQLRDAFKALLARCRGRPPLLLHQIDGSSGRPECKTAKATDDEARPVTNNEPSSSRSNEMPRH